MSQNGQNVAKLSKIIHFAGLESWAWLRDSGNQCFLVVLEVPVVSKNQWFLDLSKLAIFPNLTVKESRFWRKWQNWPFWRKRVVFDHFLDTTGHHWTPLFKTRFLVKKTLSKPHGKVQNCQNPRIHEKHRKSRKKHEISWKCHRQIWCLRNVENFTFFMKFPTFLSKNHVKTPYVLHPPKPVLSDRVRKPGFSVFLGQKPGFSVF